MKLPVIILLLVFTNSYHAQTGPAGVGTNTASTQQNRIWYKSDVGVFNNAGTTAASNGNTVQQWNDQSGVGNHGIQNTSGNRPTYLLNVANGLPALRFNGSNWITATAFPSIANNVGYTYLIVVRDTAFTAGTVGDGAGDYIIDRGPPGAEVNELAGLKVASTNKFGFQKRDGGGGGLGGPVSVSTVSTGSFQVIDYRQTPGGTKIYDLFVNGVLESTLSASDANYVPPVPQIGHHYQPASSGMKGYVTEFILYNYNVNNAQMNILNSYLAAKYGLNLAANDKYAGDAAINGNYDFEVAGVGLDASGGNSAVASSVSGGLEVTQSTAMETDEYLLFGHQAGSNFFNTSDIGGMSAGSAVGRWNRIWYLDWTHIGGSTESLNLSFDLSDGNMFGTPAAPLSNYKLLYRAGLSGNWTELASASAISGDRISFNNIAHTSGDGYYTIGTLDNVNSTLPVGLTDFNARLCEQSVCLNWSTASEKDNDFFTVERSNDGSIYKALAQIKGSGNSNVNLNYAYTDTKPPEGLSYYHLKQTDFDGQYAYSKIIAMDFSGNNTFYFKVYPSPNNGLFNLYLNDDSKISISDALGNLVMEKHYPPGNHNLDISKEQDGFYYLSVEHGTEQAHQKFLKLDR